MSVTHEHHASPLHLLAALHLPAAPEERWRQRLAAPCPLPTWPSTFPSVSLAFMNTYGARVNVGTDFWSVLVCTVAHCDVTYMDVYVVSRLTLDGTLVGECSCPSPSLC